MRGRIWRVEEVVARPALDVLVRDDVEAPAGRIADEEIDVSSEFHHDLYSLYGTTYYDNVVYNFPPPHPHQI